MMLQKIIGQLSLWVRLQNESTQVYIKWGQVSSQNLKFSTLQNGDNYSPKEIEKARKAGEEGILTAFTWAQWVFHLLVFRDD